MDIRGYSIVLSGVYPTEAGGCGSLAAVEAIADPLTSQL